MTRTSHITLGFKIAVARLPFQYRRRATSVSISQSHDFLSLPIFPSSLKDVSSRLQPGVHVLADQEADENTLTVVTRFETVLSGNYLLNSHPQSNIIVAIKTKQTTSHILASSFRNLLVAILVANNLEGAFLYKTSYFASSS